MTETVKIQLHQFQDKAIFSPSRFIAIIAGVQSGKTMAGCIWSRIQFDENPNDNGLICAPTYKILQQSTLPKFFQINPDLQKYYKKGDSIIELPGRGKIFIRSTENPNVLEGMTLRWAWLDEGGQMKLDAWVNVQGRLSIQQGKCFISTTPYYFNWLASDFLDQCKKGNKDYCAVQFRSIDSPYFPKEEYERAEKTMDRRTFERRYMGLFTKMEGLVYDDFNYAYHVNDNNPKLFDSVICGVDWGFAAPAAMVIIGIKENVYWVMDEFYGSKKTTDELIEIAKNLKDKWKINRFYADTAEPDRIEAFKRAGLYTLEANKDIEWGINKVRQLMKEERFHVHPQCKYLLDEIERYHYPEVQEDKVESEKPEKIDDHAMDAMRYAIATYQGSKFIKPNQKKVFLKKPFVVNRVFN